MYAEALYLQKHMQRELWPLWVISQTERSKRKRGRRKRAKRSKRDALNGDAER